MTLQTSYRELSVTEILSKSISLYFSRFEYFLAPVLLTNLVNEALRRLMSHFMPEFNFPQNFTDEFFARLINYLAVAIPLAIVFLVVIWIINTLCNGIIVKYSSDMLEGRHASLKNGFNSVLSNIPSLLTVGFVTGALTMLGLILFIIPGIIVAVMFSLTVQVIIIERVGVSESLGRSRKLVANRWWKTFSVLFSVFLVTAISYMIGDFVGTLFGGSFDALKWLITIIIASFVQPLHPIALTYLYYTLNIGEEPMKPAVPPQFTAPVPAPSPSPPSPVLTTFQPRFCYKCGQRLPSDAIYCPRCGEKVKP